MEDGEPWGENTTRSGKSIAATLLSMNIAEEGEITFLGRAGVACRSEAVVVNIKCFSVRGRCNIFAACLLKTVSPLARMENVPRGSFGLLGKVYFI